MPHSLTRRGVSRTFQITRGLGEMTVLENMVVGSPTTGIRSLLGSRILRRERDRAMELLDFVGISELASLAAERLSYGQKKLLEFASVLMSDPTAGPARRTGGRGQPGAAGADHGSDQAPE